MREDAFRGLGITDTRNGTEYVRWARAENYLRDIHKMLCEMCEDSTQKLSPVLAKNRDLLEKHDFKPEYITEQLFYMLAIKINTAPANKFQIFISCEVLPAIRKKGYYGKVSREEFFDIGIKLGIEADEYDHEMVRALEYRARQRSRTALPKFTQEEQERVNKRTMKNFTIYRYSVSEVSYSAIVETARKHKIDRGTWGRYVVGDLRFSKQGTFVLNKYRREMEERDRMNNNSDEVDAGMVIGFLRGLRLS